MKSKRVIKRERQTLTIIESFAAKKRGINKNTNLLQKFELRKS